MEENKQAQEGNDTSDVISIYETVTMARSVLFSTVDKIMAETGLPAVIIDGVLSDVLSDVRKKELYDLQAVSRIKKKPSTIQTQTDET